MDSVEGIEGMSQHRARTKSKWYFDDEILGVWPDGTIYLKEGVRRLSYSILEEEFEEEQFRFKAKIHNLRERRDRLDEEESNYN